MNAAKPRPPSHDTLKAFYDVAMEALELAPWTFMQEDENFAVPDPGGETFYASVIGAAGMSRSLVFYRGAGGWATFLRMRAKELRAEEAIHEVDCLNLDFEPWSQIDPDSRQRLKRVGLGSGWPFLPAPLVYRPGRRPVMPDAQEMELLTRLVRASLPSLRRSQRDPEWLLRGPTPGHLFHARLGGGTDVPVGEWLPPPSLPEKEIKVAPPDRFALKRLKEQALRPVPAWEILLGDSGATVADAQGGYFPLAALFVDSVGGFVAGAGLAVAAEMPYVLPRELIAAMHKHQARPEAFHVRRDDVAAWLQEVSRSLDIPILRKEGLPQAEAAHKALREAMKLGPRRQ